MVGGMSRMPKVRGLGLSVWIPGWKSSRAKVLSSAAAAAVEVASSTCLCVSAAAGLASVCLTGRHLLLPYCHPR